MDNKINADKIIKMGSKSVKFEKLTYEIVQEFIDCIYIYDRENIEVHFTFDDVIKKMIS